jgi:hypothetical protein
MSRKWRTTSEFLTEREDNSKAEGVAEIRATRELLGNYSLRYFTEAIYGEEYTRAIFGESGGEIKLKDIEVEFSGKEDGTFSTVIKKEIMEKILQEAHPTKTPEEIEEMAIYKPKQGDAASSAIEREVEKLNESERKIILDFMKNINK